MPLDCRYGLADPGSPEVKQPRPPDVFDLYLNSTAGGRRRHGSTGATRRRHLPTEFPAPHLAGLEPKADIARIAAEAARPAVVLASKYPAHGGAAADENLSLMLGSRAYKARSELLTGHVARKRTGGVPGAYQLP